ncbi:hypothetical protein HOLleu_20368 [Holothuria leucospilota]|uniref:Uncharacterized protein n=1 Tax=Holothuria leucospilota TaxID=206669 RepID=A0A9Q1C0P5_HOLLE|nr:hypothetical protein HOLleu_20368 [Holothuria leucospilota]
MADQEDTATSSELPQVASSKWSISCSVGPHIVILTLCCIPVVFVLAVFYNAYLGVLTWYNVFLFYYDEKTFLHRVTICPILIFLFPPTLFVLVLVISCYVALKQIAYDFVAWKYKVQDLEKGAYAKICQKIGLPECCPYETVILQTDDLDNIETAKENTSLQPTPRHS